MSLTQRGQDQSSMYLRTAGVTTGHSSLTCKFCEYSQCRQIQILLGLWYFNQSFIVLWVIKHHISFSQWFNCLVPKKFVSKNSQKKQIAKNSICPSEELLPAAKSRGHYTTMWSWIIFIYKLYVPESSFYTP